MSYDERLSAALDLIKQHNEVVGEGNPGYILPEKFLANLKAFGATNEESLWELRYEDVLKCLKHALAVESPVAPEKLAKHIAESFREGKKQEESPEAETKYVSQKKVRRMSLRQLVENFDPEEYNNPVGKRLKEYVGDKPCIVFDKVGSRDIDIESTFKLVKELKSGFPARKTIPNENWAVIVVNGENKAAYPIGYIPSNYAEENPLYPGRPLRPDGTCDQTNRSWEGVPLEVRQFVRIGLELKEIRIGKLEDAHDILDRALQENALEKLASRYARASVKFQELQHQNKLPDLLIPLDNSQKKSSNPFESGAQVSWEKPPVPSANYYVSSHTLNRNISLKWKEKKGQ